MLRDEPGGECWIETLRRRGYWFVGPTAAAPNRQLLARVAFQACEGAALAPNKGCTARRHRSLTHEWRPHEAPTVLSLVHHIPRLPPGCRLMANANRAPARTSLCKSAIGQDDCSCAISLRRSLAGFAASNGWQRCTRTRRMYRFGVSDGADVPPVALPLNSHKLLTGVISQPNAVDRRQHTSP